jgi:hypothetical protein
VQYRGGSSYGLSCIDVAISMQQRPRIQPPAVSLQIPLPWLCPCLEPIIGSVLSVVLLVWRSPPPACCSTSLLHVLHMLLLLPCSPQQGYDVWGCYLSPLAPSTEQLHLFC